MISTAAPARVVKYLELIAHSTTMAGEDKEAIRDFSEVLRAQGPRRREREGNSIAEGDA